MFFYIKKIIAARLMKMDHWNNSLVQSKRVRFNYIKTFLFPGILPDVSHNFEGVISLKENFFLEFERKFFIQKRNVFKWIDIKIRETQHDLWIFLTSLCFKFRAYEFKRWKIIKSHKNSSLQLIFFVSFLFLIFFNDWLRKWKKSSRIGQIRDS